MKRLVITGSSMAEITKRVDDHTERGWKALGKGIVPHPDAWNRHTKSRFVCVMEQKLPK